MACSVIESMNVLGKKWTVPIIEEIALGEFNGFNDFSKRAGVTPHMLSKRLKELESMGLVDKSPGSAANHEPTRYMLTPSGIHVRSLVQDMKRHHVERGELPDSCLVTSCTRCGRFGDECRSVL